MNLITNWLDIRFANSVRIRGIGLSERCPVGCSHCGISLTPTGYKMTFSDLQRIIAFEDLKLDKKVFVSFGDPLYYRDDGKDVSDVVSLLLGRGVERVRIVTTGFNPDQHAILKTVKSLAQYKGKVECILSFNLFQRNPQDTARKVVHTIETLSEVGVPVGLDGTYSLENKEETDKELARVIDILREHKRKPPPSDMGQISRVGRAKDVTAHEFNPETPKRSCCIHSGSGGRRLTINPRGDLLPCTTITANISWSVANVFEHTWEGIAARYKDYIEQHERHQRMRPEGVTRCVWHHSFEFKPPAPKKAHLRARA